MIAPRRIAGVLGGMGPAATLDFAARVYRLSRAARGPGTREQDDVRLLIDCNPAVPDRNAAVAGTGPSPGPMLAAMARGLAGSGADFLVMPCNAAHAFAGDIRSAVDLPFVGMIDETAAQLAADHPAVRRAGILAVAATAQARLYEQALAPHNVAGMPPEGAARARFMDLIWRIKDGARDAAVRAAMRDAALALVEAGAELIIAGCTEVPLVLAAPDLPVPLIDATEILARRTVAYALGAPLVAR